MGCRNNNFKKEIKKSSNMKLYLQS